MTEANGEYKDTAQIRALDEDDQRIKYLLEQWSMTDKAIVGTLQQRGELWWLTQVTDIEGRRLEYPISDFPERATQLRRGVFVEPGFHGMADGQVVQASFTLAAEKYREQWNNPLLIRVAVNSLRPLARISSTAFRYRQDGSIDLDETLYHAFLERTHPELATRLQETEAQIVELQRKSEEINQRHADVINAIEFKESAVAALAQELSEAQAAKDRILAEIESGFQAECKRYDDDLEKQRTNLKLEFTLEKDQYEQEIDRLYREREATRFNNAEEKITHINQANSLRNYVRANAQRLRVPYRPRPLGVREPAIGRGNGGGSDRRRERRPRRLCR
jgi:hypothetical protein